MALGGTDLNLLDALRVLLEEANVTHAGHRLNMSQPAMSGALARLRRHFGDELLVRDGRDYVLTPLAIDLLPIVQHAQHCVREALGTADAFDAATSRQTFRLASSDYALNVVHEPLMRRVAVAAPSIRFEFDHLGDDVRTSDRQLLSHDVLIGPMGYGFPGTAELLFRDRMVCLVDRANPWLVDSTLTMGDLGRLPHAVASFGAVNLTPADRILGELGVARRVQVSVTGFLALPLVIEHTDMVAVVPERLARRFCGRDSRLLLVEPPFGQVDLVEAFWFQGARAPEPALRWLLSVLREVAGDLCESAGAADVVTPLGGSTQH